MKEEDSETREAVYPRSERKQKKMSGDDWEGRSSARHLGNERNQKDESGEEKQDTLEH